MMTNVSRRLVLKCAQLTRPGTVLALGLSFNVRGKVTNALAAADLAYRYGYAFDDIGNRNTAAERGTNFAYTANALNQYTGILGGLAPFSPEYDLDGNRGGGLGTRASLPENARRDCAPAGRRIRRRSVLASTSHPRAANPPMFRQAGIPSARSQAGYSRAFSGSSSYDRMGRRVVRDMSVSGSLAESKRFAYDNYLLVQENDLATDYSSASSQSFVWDPTEPVATKPLVYRNGTTLAYYVHDGNKNVSALVGGVSTVAASYVYAPFGAVISSSGALAAANPFRFSSEYSDDTLGLVYYNYRHYNPADGRWTSRDPIAISADSNICANNALSCYDICGLLSIGTGGDGSKNGMGIKGHIAYIGYVWDWNLEWALSFTEEGAFADSCQKTYTGDFSLNAEIGLTAGYSRTFHRAGYDVMLLAGIRAFTGIRASTQFSVVADNCYETAYQAHLEGVGYVGAEGGVLARVRRGTKINDYGFGIRLEGIVGVSLDLQCSNEICKAHGRVGVQKVSIDTFLNLSIFSISYNLYDQKDARLLVDDVIEFKNPFGADVRGDK